MHWSPDLRVMLAPAATYGQIVAQHESSRWLAIRRPALVALVLGTGTTFSATGHVTLALLVSGFVCWSLVTLIQMMTAAIIMRSRASHLGLAQRLDLWFMGHAPWSLWIVAVTLLMGAAPSGARIERVLMLSALVPAVWTAVIGAAFCRVVLKDSRRAAVARTALHQAITWTIALVYIALAVALWSRLVAMAGA
jgi:hypothetical protein